MGNNNFNVLVDVFTIDGVGRLAWNIHVADGKNDGKSLCRIGN